MMNRFLWLGLIPLAACGGPASVRTPPAPSITPGALSTMKVRPDAAKPNTSQLTLLKNRWDTSHLQSAHTPGEHQPKTFHEHDLIEVLVRESSRSERSAELSTQRRADLDAGINRWPNFRALLDEQLGEDYNGGLPGVAGSIQNRHETEGEFEREDSFTARVMAEVAQVLPNGNLILEARSVTEVDGERSAIVVRGRCRAEDVSQLNTVYSTQLHDLEVTQHSEGELRRSSKKPWITRILDTIFGV